MIALLTLGLALAKDGAGVYHKPGEGVELRADASPAELLLNAWVQPTWGLTFTPGQPGGEGLGTGPFQVRRGRLSVTASPTKTLSAEVELGVDRLEPRVVDAFAVWSPNDTVRLRVGKMRPPTGLERETSARLIPTLERSGVAQLVAQRTEAVELRLRHGPASLSLAALRPVESAELHDPQNRAVDLAAVAALRGESARLGLRGGLLARPTSVSTVSNKTLLDQDLAEDRAWTGTGTALGVDAVAVFGPARVAVEGAGLREGVTVGTLDAHTLHGAAYALVGVAPGGTRTGLNDSAALVQGWEVMARADTRVVLPAVGVGTPSWWAETLVGGSYAPQPGTRLTAELGPTWILREGEAQPRPTFAARLNLIVGF